MPDVDFYWHLAPHFLIALTEIISTIFAIRSIIASQNVWTQPFKSKPCIVSQSGTPAQERAGNKIYPKGRG